MSVVGEGEGEGGSKVPSNFIYAACILILVLIFAQPCIDMDEDEDSMAPPVSKSSTENTIELHWDPPVVTSQRKKLDVLSSIYQYHLQHRLALPQASPMLEWIDSCFEKKQLMCVVSGLHPGYKYEFRIRYGLLSPSSTGLGSSSSSSSSSGSSSSSSSDDVQWKTKFSAPSTAYATRSSVSSPTPDALPRAPQAFNKVNVGYASSILVSWDVPTSMDDEVDQHQLGGDNEGDDASNDFIFHLQVSLDEEEDVRVRVEETWTTLAYQLSNATYEWKIMGKDESGESRVEALASTKHSVDQHPVGSSSLRPVRFRYRYLKKKHGRTHRVDDSSSTWKQKQKQQQQQTMNGLHNALPRWSAWSVPSKRLFYSLYSTNNIPSTMQNPIVVPTVNEGCIEQFCEEKQTVATAATAAITLHATGTPTLLFGFETKVVGRMLWAALSRIIFFANIALGIVLTQYLESLVDLHSSGCTSSLLGKPWNLASLSTTRLFYQLYWALLGAYVVFVLGYEFIFLRHTTYSQVVYMLTVITLWNFLLYACCALLTSDWYSRRRRRRRLLQMHPQEDQ